MNGVEVYRQNMPAGTPSYSTSASTAVSQPTLSTEIDLPSSALRSGLNTLAVELHRSSAGDTTLGFGAELDAVDTISPATTYQSSPEEWLELYNDGTTTVDMSGWSLAGDIAYTIPQGTKLGAGQYLVIAKDVAYMQSLYPTLNVLGNYQHSLPSDGYVALEDASGNPADQVRYYSGGDWPSNADGGGSSLERVDPHADSMSPSTWADSVSTGVPWQTYTYTAVAQTVVGVDYWNEFIMGLINTGEVLLDDFSVIQDPAGAATQMLLDGSFEGDTSSWRLLGNEDESKVIVDPTNPNNHVLDLIATGPTENIINHVETTLANGASVTDGVTYQISFRAKWISGSDQLNTHLYFERVAQTTILPETPLDGTPGAQNSTYVGNVGPSYTGVQQSPVVPTAGQSVTVSTAISDPDGVASAVLWYEPDGGTWSSTPMTLGTGGLYSGVIPGQAAGTIMQFYVQSTDSRGAVSTYPAAGAASRALYQVNNGAPVSSTIHNIRIIMTAADDAILQTPTNVMSDQDMSGTVIYDENQVFYNVGISLQGSERGRDDPSRVGFHVDFNPDDLFRGVQPTISLDRSGGYSGLGGKQDEIVVEQARDAAGGMPTEYDDLINIIAPQSAQDGTSLLLMDRYGDDYLNSQYPDGADGTVFKFELDYYPLTTTDGNPQSLKLPQPDNVWGTDITYLGANPENYRANFLIESNRTQDDYGPIIALASAMSQTGAALDTATQAIMDVPEWMRTFAMLSLGGVADSYTQGYPHNLQLYVNPSTDKIEALPWDWDFDWAEPTNAPLWGSGTTLSNVIALPENTRLFEGDMLDIINSSFNPQYMSQWTTAYGNLAGQNYSGILNYITQRDSYVLSQLPTQISLSITTNGGLDFSTNQSSVTITGNAWINAEQLELAGSTQPLNVTWTSPETWQVTLPLHAGSNTLTFEGIGFEGQAVGSATIHVTANQEVLQDNLRVTEIMYDPAAPSSGSPYAADDFQYIELQNTGTQPLDLTGVQLSGGVTFTFPSMSLPAGGYTLVVRNPAAFASLYGSTAAADVAGTFSGTLSHSGAEIVLEDSTGTTIHDFTYSSTWYPITAGLGFSLVVTNPLADPSAWNLSSGWKPSGDLDGSPGAADTIPNPGTVVINEVLANTTQAVGQWIELANTGSTPVDVSLWYLSNSSANLTQFQIPAGTVIPAGGFVTFTSTQDFDNAADPGDQTPFALNPLGDSVFLSSHDPTGVAGGYRDSESFGASDPEVSFGYYVKSTGDSDFVAMSSTTFDAANSPPRVGPIVFNELMYDPKSPGDEYIELYNNSSQAVPLYDPQHPADTWQFTNGITFSFPTGVVIPAGGYAIVSSLTPAAFEAEYPLPAGTQVFGPYGGALDNSGEKVTLSKPGVPQPGGSVPYIQEEHVNYSDVAPWPTTPHGSGPSLERISATSYGNDVINWEAGPNGGTPGLANNPLALSVADVSQLEGNSGSTNMLFAVSLTLASAQTITVNYNTADGTATAGSDYTAEQGVLTFAPGVTSQTITVSVLGDTLPEPNELFYVNLSDASGADLQKLQGVGTIIDDDSHPSASANTGLTVAPGSTTTIAASNLSYISNSNSAAQLTYTITSGPNHGTLEKSGSATTSFTQADINSGLITYVQNGGAAASDSFNFTITAPVGPPTSGSFAIGITALVLINNVPTTVQTGANVQLGTQSLEATEVGKTSSQLIYTIGTYPTAGELFDGATLLPAGGTFSQADINAGGLHYLSTGSATTTDGFTFTVSDGAGGVLGPASFVLNVVAPPVAPPGFTPGNLIVYRVGDVTKPAGTSSATAVYLDEYTPGGTLVQSISLPSTAVGGLALTDSGKASSGGLFSLSPDGSQIALFGYNFAAGTASATSAAAETVGIVGASGTPLLEGFVDQATSNARSAAYDPATGKLYTSGGLGLFESSFSAGGTPTTVQIVSGSTADVQILNGVVFYVSGTSVFSLGGEPTAATAGISVVSNGSGTSPTQFFFARLGTGSTFGTTGADTLYVADSKATNGTLFKYTWNGTAWSAAGSITGPDTASGNQLLGVSGTVSGTTATIYFTEGNTGSGTVGDVYKFSDTFGATISNGVSAPVRIVNVTAQQNFRGIVLAPDDGVGAIGGLGASTPYSAGSPAAVVGPEATFSDASNFMGGSLKVSISGGGAAADALGLLAGNNITFTGTTSGNVLYAGNLIGTYVLTSGASSTLTVTFNTAGPETAGNTPANPVSSAAIQSLIQQITFSTTGAAGNRTISFQVTESSGASDTAASQTVSVASHVATVVSANTGLTVVQFGAGVITSSNLSYTSATDSAAQLTYSITVPPAHGTLKKSGSATASFTQADINNGLISYGENGDDTTADSFNFTVTDSENSSTSGSFAITIIAPVLVTNLTTTVQAGSSVTINTASLKTTESGKTSSQLIYTIGTAPTNGHLTNTQTHTTLAAGSKFTQADIDSNFISYTNTNSAAAADSFTFTVTDGGSGSTGSKTFSLLVNHAPTVIANLGLSVNPGQGATVTTSLLSVNDIEQGAASLTYTIGTASTAGTLFDGANPLAAGGTFTQADIIAGNIHYLSTGSAPATDSFTFSVSDGAGGVLGSASFALDVVPLSSVSYAGGSYSQNFDGLPTSGSYSLYSDGPIALDTSSILTTGLAGWSFGNTSATEKFFASDGPKSQTTGGVYSFGSGTDTPAGGIHPASDRALGLIGTSSLESAIGVTLVNTSGQTLNQISISYNGELWHLGTSTAPNPLTFGFAVGAASITDSSATFGADSNLDYSVTGSGTAGAEDGNANSSAKSDTITGLAWAPGQTLVLRWSIGGVAQAPGLAIDDFSFSADAAPVVAINTGLTTQVNQSVAITSAMLTASDADNTAGQLTYTVTSLPTNGTLSIGGTAQTAIGGSFTQTQLNTGTFVSFTAGSSKVSSSFGFKVADPAGASASGSFSLGIGDSPPLLATNAGLTVVQGGSGVVTTSQLQVTDPDNTDSQLVFTLGSVPVHGTLTNTSTHTTLAVGSTFTEQDFDNHNISYQNDNTAISSDNFAFSVSDGAGGSITSTTFHIAVNLLPALVNNTGLATPAGAVTFLSKSMLNATGTGSSAQIEYTLQSLPTAGSLFNTTVSTTVPLTVGSTFFQNTVSGTSTIEYVSSAAAVPGSSDSFSLTVTDTSYASNQPTLGPATFNISVNPALSTVSYTGGRYTQSFDSLPASSTLVFAQAGPFDLSAAAGTRSATSAQGVSAAGLTGWSMNAFAGASPLVETFLSDSGSGKTTGGVYSVGNFAGDTANAGNLALGNIGSSSTDSEFGITLTNNSGVTLNTLNVGYTGEQWSAFPVNQQALTFYYQLGASSLAGAVANGTKVSGLSYTTSITGGTSSTPIALDGALAANQTAVSGTINSLNWAPGQTLTLVWQGGVTSKSAAAAIDNFQLSATQSTPNVSLATATQSVNENRGTFTVTVNLSAVSATDTTVPFTLGGTAVNGTNYSAATASPLVIPAGQTSATISGTLLDDGHFYTTNRTLTVSLGTPVNATLGAISTDTITIVESDLPLSAAIAPVSTPRNAAVDSMTITFSAPVTGFSLSNLQLRVDGGPNLLTAAQTLTSTDNKTWILGNLTGLTGTCGSYVLSLSAAGIQDAANNTLSANISSDFTVDNVAPTVAITPVSPNPRNTAVGSLTITFSKPIVGFSIGSLQLSVGGGPNLLTAAQTLTTTDNTAWTLGNLASLTAASGAYTLTLSPGGIGDAVGNALAAGASSSFTLHAWENIANRFDVNNSGDVSPLDALNIINYLNLHGASVLPPTFTGPDYLDANGDDDVSALDVLNVINYINNLLASPASPTAVSAASSAVATALEPAIEGQASSPPDAAITWAVSVAVSGHLPATSPASSATTIATASVAAGAATVASGSMGVSQQFTLAAAVQPRSADSSVRDAVWGVDEFDASAGLSERLLTLLGSARRPQGRST